jgi:secondary thiamine-phosphate synthase enzyme
VYRNLWGDITRFLRLMLALIIVGSETERARRLGRSRNVSYQQHISVSTQGHGDMQDLTEMVAKVVRSSGVTTGTVNVFNIGSTAAVGTIEFEPGLRRDLPRILDQLIPPSRNYGHEQTWHDGNAHSHLQATLLGPSLTVPIADGKLVLGTWQQIFHLECDVRGRRRTILVTVLGD